MNLLEKNFQFIATYGVGSGNAPASFTRISAGHLRVVFNIPKLILSMNNSQTSASPLAKRDYFQQVVDQANENRYNWFPLVEYLTFGNQPEDVANCVLECYVQLSQYIMKDQENAGYEDLIDSVYSLKLLYDGN